MKHRLPAILAWAILLSAGMTPALAEEPAPPTVTIQYFEEGAWYPLLVPNDTPLTAEGLPGAITGVDNAQRRWEVPVRWDTAEHQAEIASFQDFTIHAFPQDTLAGPGDVVYQIKTEGPAAEPFDLPIHYFQRGPIGTDERLKLTGSYAPWRGRLTLTYNKLGSLDAAPPDADRVLIQSSADLVSWQTVLDVTGGVGGRFDVEVPAQRTETLYYRVWVEGGPQAGASIDYVVLEASAQRPKTHTVTLEDGLVVKEGEHLVYLTVAEGMLDSPEGGLYPGELILQAEGQIVVESGGSLTIGTYSSGGPEKRPVLRGALSQDGLIRVEPGGVLQLDGVTLELEGQEGYAVWQEDGGAVNLLHTELAPAQVQWGAPLVDNSYLRLEDLWLEAGTPLAQAPLPQEAETWVQDRGGAVRSVLPIRWDLGEDAGRTAGEAVISGAFLDGAGDPMPMLAPLELSVRWYAPEEIPLTGSSWLGDAAPTARLHFSALPDQAAELWGEWSEDGGATWTRWEQCAFKESGSGPYCVFAAPDSTPRLYRVVGVSAGGKRHWASKGVLLPGEDTDPEDPDGNRGGSTGVIRPDREPEPEETPAPQPAPPMRPAPGAAPEPLPEQAEDSEAAGPFQPPASSRPPEVPAMPPSAPPRQEPSRGAEQPGAAPAPEAGLAPEADHAAPMEPAQAPAQAAKPEPSIPPPGAPAPSEPKAKAPPDAAQAALAAAGLGGCVLAGLGLTGNGPFKKRK